MRFKKTVEVIVCDIEDCKNTNDNWVMHICHFCRKEVCPNHCWQLFKVISILSKINFDDGKINKFMCFDCYKKLIMEKH